MFHFDFPHPVVLRPYSWVGAQGSLLIMLGWRRDSRVLEMEPRSSACKASPLITAL